jgi:subtilisin family serine protease
LRDHGSSVPTNFARHGLNLFFAATMLLQGSWGLERIERRAIPLTGRGVHAYVIDTGVRRTHADFGGRADWIGDFVGGAPAGPDADDCDPPPSGGHGTHVADILGGLRFGVANAVRIHALRILPCTGTTRTDVDAAVRAIDWITAHGAKPAVVNISPMRAETPDHTVDAAVERSIAAGFVYVASAGGMPEIGRFTPQRVPGVIVVGASTRDNRAVQSEYGPLLTLFAPGVQIEAAGRASDSATFADDGDSYAAPFVAGAAALFLERHPQATPANVRDALIAGAARDALANVGRAPNRLLRAIQ